MVRKLGRHTRCMCGGVGGGGSYFTSLRITNCNCLEQCPVSTSRSPQHLEPLPGGCGGEPRGKGEMSFRGKNHF